MELQHLTPSRTEDTPIYLQLYHRYRDAIASGKLRPGERVPSVRSLASELNLARGTVELAYQILSSEGYLQTRGPAGSFVSARVQSLTAAKATTAGPAVRSVEAFSSTVQPFQLGLPALDAFPRKTWARLAGRNARQLALPAMTYPDPAGHAALRSAIASYLGISRGISCSPDQVFITAGYRGALNLVCRTLLKAGDLGWFEEPGFLFARQFLERAGMRLQPVPVDEHGLNVSQARQQAAKARFAVVTPTHQSPMGVTLSLPRRLELLEWASRRQAWIIEDDYDSEFRYHGRPLPALKSLDRDGRVLYTGTFSKVLLPGLGLAYLVVPPAQVAQFRDAVAHLPGTGSMLPQATVADFMEQGHFARHLRKMRALYALRRSYLEEALAAIFGPQLQVQTQAGGIHMLALLPQGLHRHSDQTLATAAQSHGLAVQALSLWSAAVPARQGLLLGFANIESPAMARQWCLQLKAAIDSLT